MTLELNGSILVVDDEPANLGVLFEFLDEAGYEVFVVENGRRALEVVERINPDVLLLDIKLPDIDGFEVYRRLQERELTDDITVIFLSVLAETEHIVRGLDLNAVDYITKPFHPQEVVARVQKHLILHGLRRELEEKNSQLIQEIEIRKSAENALRIERDSFFNILESMPDGIFIVDQDYEVRYVNPVLKEEIGMVQGQKCFEIFHDRKEICPWCHYPKVFAGETIRWEWYSEKNLKFYDLVDTPLKNADGSVWILEIFRDITERKEMEAVLAEKTDYLDNIMSSATDSAIITTDLELNITYFNPVAEQIYGISAEQAIGNKIADVCPLEIPSDRKAQGIEKVRGEGSHSYEMDIEVGGKLRSYNQRLSGIIDHEGKLIGYARFSRDITDRKRAEKAFRELSLVEERQRLARNLHDSMTQSIHSLSMAANESHSALVDEQYESLPELLEILIDGTKFVSKELQLLLHELQVIPDERTDLFDILRTRLENVGKHTGIETHFCVEGNWKLDKSMEIEIYYIAQEALNNALKHANSNEINISLDGTPTRVILTVSDKGNGFPSPVSGQINLDGIENPGMGLKNMLSRTEKLMGDLSLDSSPGNGATIKLEVAIAL